MARRLCRLAFWLALLPAAVLGCGQGGKSPQPPPRVLGQDRGPPAPALHPRPFLDTFLRYEVGARAPTLRRHLRHTATRPFSAELLADRPRASRLKPPAHIARLQITPLSDHPPRALVLGTAIRAARPEPFAFLFEARRGRWLAAGPAE